MYEATLMRRGCCEPIETGICLTGTPELVVSLEKKRSKMPDLRLLAREGVRSIGLDSEAVLQADREGTIMGGVGSAAW